jgi:dihydrofolate synthase/folylpolyglutamate synthase
VGHWDPHPTFFEISLALAMRHFVDEASEVIILETGMGGRLDATNAIQAQLSVITSISLDHQQWLGETLREIAAEKAGILKPDTPVIVADLAPEARDVVGVEIGRAMADVARRAFARGRAAGREEIKKEYGL